MSELRNLLLVEDDPDIALIATMALEVVGGYQVRVASTGSEAVAELASNRPDLVLLDVMLPDTTGVELLESIRGDVLTWDLPVVFMTARVDPPSINAYLDLGAQGVVRKPFDVMTLPSQVEALWGAQLQH